MILKKRTYTPVILGFLSVFYLLFFISIFETHASSSLAVCSLSVNVNGSTVTISGTVTESHPGQDTSFTNISLFDDAGGPGFDAWGGDQVFGVYSFVAPGGTHTAFIAGQSWSNQGGGSSACSRSELFTVVTQVWGCTDPNATNYDPSATNDDGSCTYTYFVNLNFWVRNQLNQGIQGASVNISQDFGNGTNRSTDGGGFANFGVHNDTNIGWSVSANSCSSQSGSVNSGSGGATVNVGLTCVIQCSGSDTQSCSNACNSGTQTRTCNTSTGQWSDWSSCSAPPPPSNYGNACTSSPNACGQTNSGTIQCDGSCSVTTPSNSSCPAPNAPSNVTNTEPNYCVSGPAATISWTYSDPSGSPQQSYQVQITDTGNFNNPIFDSGKINSGSNSFFTGQGFLAFNTTYKARVKVWNSFDVESAWSGPSSSWKTPPYAYPQTNFTWTANGISENPSPPLNKPVAFTDTTVFNGNPNGREWDWLFGDSGSSTQQNPSHTYLAEGSYYVTLTATDNANQSCSRTRGPLIIQKPIPKWREVAPR